jgi:hypothetical protein
MTLDIDHDNDHENLSFLYTQTTMACDTTPKLAVLVDAENAQYSIIGLLLAEIAKYGTAHVKRAFGDWTDHRLDGWSNELLNQSIQPIQQNAYTHGKNTTDSAMIINAMDLLNSNCVDGFCLVSSDSDFTPLATRVRESGLMVFGFGERKTPKPFVAACDKFIYTEDLVYPSGLAPHSDRAEVPQSHDSVQQAKEDGHPAIRQQNTVETSLNNSGWARLSDVGEHLTTQHPEFNISTHGYSKLSKLFSDSTDFDIEHRLSQADKPPELYVRKRKTSPRSAPV